MPRIFYWMTDSPVATGGEKHSYEHVDILNTSGFDAYAVHLTGEGYTWVDKRPRIVCGPDFWEIFDPRDDYLVVPEVLGTLIGGLPGKIVIFNKNLYHGFSTHEGLQRVLLEGMAAGCILACHGTGPAREFLPPEHSFEQDNLMAMARHVESIVDRFPDNVREWEPVVDRARQTAAAFSPASARAVVAEAWREIFESDAATATATAAASPWHSSRT